MQRRAAFVGACFAVFGLQFVPQSGVAGARAAVAEKARPTPAVARSRCSALATRPIDDAQVVSARVQPSAQQWPEYCRVLVIARPAITIEVRMPPQNWNGKLYFGGCGGACGRLGTEAPSGPPGYPPVREALRRGYAIVTTDTGHWGEHAGDYRWAMNNPVGIADFAAHGVHRALVVAKDLVAAYYGSEIKRSYFEGCSNGGRQGLIEAQRYPEDFDGIISGAPGFDFTGQLAAWIFDAKVDTDSQARRILPPAKIESLRKAVIKSCGDREGVVEDPRACRFDPGVMECGADRDDKCLTPQEIAVARDWYRGPGPWLTDGADYGGLPLGSEANWAMWVGPDGLLTTIGREAVRYLVVPAHGPDFDMLQSGLAPIRPGLEALSAQLNPDSVDLSKFRAHGGRLLVWHGWADPAISPARTIAYFTSMQHAMGGEQATAGFARLFMIAGMNHCGFVDASPGIDFRGMDLLSEMEKWSEGSVAPESIVTTKKDLAGQVLWSRPICSFPKTPRHEGPGDRKDANSWRCVDVAETASAAH